MLVSASDGFLIDTKPPVIIFDQVGIFGNETEREIRHEPSLYQVEGDTIYLEWNSSDIVSGIYVIIYQFRIYFVSCFFKIRPYFTIS